MQNCCKKKKKKKKQYHAQGHAVSPHRHAVMSCSTQPGAPSLATPSPVINYANWEGADWTWVWNASLSVPTQTFMEDVKSRGPFIYSVLESAQAFLAQHPFQEPEETLTEGKGPLLSYSVPTAIPAKKCHNNKLLGVKLDI